MKHLFTLEQAENSIEFAAYVPENTEVLLQGQPFSDKVQVFVPIGFLNKSEDLSSKIGAYVHGRRWANLTRNDGHYLEIEVEEHDDTQGASNAKKA